MLKGRVSKSYRRRSTGNVSNRNGVIVDDDGNIIAWTSPRMARMTRPNSFSSNNQNARPRRSRPEQKEEKEEKKQTEEKETPRERRHRLKEEQ